MAFIDELRAIHNTKPAPRTLSEEESINQLVRDLVYRSIKEDIRTNAMKTASNHIAGDYIIETIYSQVPNAVPYHGPFWSTQFIDGDLLTISPLCTAKVNLVLGINVTVSMTAAGKSITRILSELAAKDNIQLSFYPVVGEARHFQLSAFDKPESIPYKKMTELAKQGKMLGQSTKVFISKCAIMAHYELDI